MKKEPPPRPPAPSRRRKRSERSTKSLGGGHTFKDSPFPERQTRGIIAPIRPPRRGSCSSLVDSHKYMKNKKAFLSIDIRYTIILSKQNFSKEMQFCLL